MELDKDKIDFYCTVCKMPAKYGDASGSYVLLQEKLSYIGKLRKGERRYQTEAEKGQGLSPFSFLPLYLLQTALGWIPVLTMLL